MIYAMCTHITDADFLTEDARATVEVCDWAHLSDDLGYPDWDYISKMALRNMEQKC